MLVVLSGLPGAGKTTIAKALVAKRSAVYVRVDEIEHALTRNANLGSDIGPAGYIVAFAVASSNLKLGNLVVGACVNPVPASRQGWRDVAQGAQVRFVDVEVVCSDEQEHRRRVETRGADLIGFTLPTWSSVKAHHYMPWNTPRLVVDTALLSPDQAVAAIEAHIDATSESASITP
jgi:predicted kinase